jgi:hypothetical protein
MIAGCSSPPAPSPPNELPVANAGADQTVMPGARVQIDGSSSSDPEGAVLTYSWSANPENPAQFPLPENTAAFIFIPVQGGVYRFALQVSDGKAISLDDSISVTVLVSDNSPPVAAAGPNFSQSLGLVIRLSAVTSSDPDGDELSYSWIIVAAPTETSLEDSTADQISFTPSAVGSYHVRLTGRTRRPMMC